MVIYLLGFMGAGKTTLGRQLADELGYAFTDTDHIIEEHLHTTIAAYFKTHGEAAFRQVEAQMLRNLDTSANTVVATGGGLPCFHHNMEWMNLNGITIYIKQDLDELIKRLQNQYNERPMLNLHKNTSLTNHINGLIEKREPFYTLAKFTFKGPIVPPQTVINTIFPNVNK